MKHRERHREQRRRCPGRWLPGGVAPAAALLVALAAYPRPSTAAEVGIRLVDPPATGTVVIAGFDSADGFRELRNPLQRVTHPLTGGPVCRIGNLPAGDYALPAYHDENGNGRLDRDYVPKGFAAINRVF